MVLNDDVWRVPPDFVYMEEPPPPGSLPVQSTNSVSHLLSQNKALNKTSAWVNAEKYSSLPLRILNVDYAFKLHLE